MKYLYTPFDVAVYFTMANLTISQEQSVLASLWEQRNTLIWFPNRKDKRKFLKSVNLELNRLQGFLDCTDELNLIFREMGSNYSLSESSYEEGIIESYFKVIKLRLTYTVGIDYCKIKLRNLIGRFGYKRRSDVLVEYINRTINSLGLRTYLRGWGPCDISTVPLDDIIVIRKK